MTNKAAAEILSSADFSAELEKLTKANGRQVKVRRNSLGQSDMMSINFVNLPPGVGSAGGGAEAENNRALFFVDGWDKKDENAPAPTGKVKVEMSISLYAGHGEKQPKKFRAKTGTPAQVCKYLADYINYLAKEFEPRYTHTAPKTASERVTNRFVGAAVAARFIEGS
jgi:hypothetical protein